MSNLSTTESIKLFQLEQEIEAGKDALNRMARALMMIRKDRLYRSEYATFEDYCQTRWNFGDRFAQYLINHAETVETIESRTMVRVLPENERQTRPLAALEPEEKVEGWQASVTLAKDQKPTSAHTARAAAAVKAKAMPPQTGQMVTVLDEGSPHYGKTVEVLGVENVVVEAVTETGEKVTLLTNEITPDAPPEPIAPKASKPNHYESLESRLLISEQRIEYLESLLRAGLKLFEEYEVSETEQAWIDEVNETID